MLGVGQRFCDLVLSSLSDPERIAHEKLLKRSIYSKVITTVVPLKVTACEKY